MKTWIIKPSASLIFLLGLATFPASARFASRQLKGDLPFSFVGKGRPCGGSQWL